MKFQKFVKNNICWYKVEVTQQKIEEMVAVPYHVYKKYLQNLK